MKHTNLFSSSFNLINTKFFFPLTFLIFLILSLNYSVSKAQSITFEKTFGGVLNERVYAVKQTTDGGMIITGWTQSYGDPMGDVYLLKTDKNGDKEWLKIIGGEKDDGGTDIVRTMDGGYIIAGHTVSYGAGECDVFMVKTDASGETEWTKTYGEARDEAAHSIAVTSDGGYIMTGYKVAENGIEDLYLIRTDSKGETLWERTFGGDAQDVGEHVLQTADGGFLVFGHTGTVGVIPNDMYLIKTNENGDMVWEKRIGNPALDEKAFYAVPLVRAGGFAIVGYGQNPKRGDYDVLVLRMDQGGNILWKKYFGSGEDEFGYAIQENLDCLVISGFANRSENQDVMLLKVHQDGKLMWMNYYGGDDIERTQSICITPEDDIVSAGYTGSYGEGGTDVYLLKTNSDGEISTYISPHVEEESQLQVFPNPFISHINFQLGNEPDNSVRIYDMMGKIVYQIEKASNLVKIRLPIGSYTYEIVSGEEIIKKGLIVSQ